MFSNTYNGIDLIIYYGPKYLTLYIDGFNITTVYCGLTMDKDMHV